ncbi:MAG: hypothetical protein NT027_20740 [Proteobacteria bacterium]|nr:hypothetical protein [Pseudomonadota bacterium]
MLKKSRLLMSLWLGASGLTAFSTYAVGEEAAKAVPDLPETPSSFISDGSYVKFDSDRASIKPIVGWDVSPKSAGMSLVMKEVVKRDPTVAIDYSKPLFSRNMSILALNEAAPIDEARAVAFEEQFLKMVQRDGSMKNFQFTSRKFFNYKAENDGLVFFAQHDANGFPMMQMLVLVSGDARQYVMIYTDLASSFSNAETYSAAWNSMTSVQVEGLAPKRYYREAQIGGAFLAGILMLVAPFGLARFASQRRIKKMVKELQSEWDNGDVSSTQASNISHLDTTRIAASKLSRKNDKKDVSEISKIEDSLYVSNMSSISR